MAERIGRLAARARLALGNAIARFAWPGVAAATTREPMP